MIKMVQQLDVAGGGAAERAFLEEYVVLPTIHFNTSPHSL